MMFQTVTPPSLLLYLTPSDRGLFPSVDGCVVLPSFAIHAIPHCTNDLSSSARLSLSGTRKPPYCSPPFYKGCARLLRRTGSVCSCHHGTNGNASRSASTCPREWRGTI